MEKKYYVCPVCGSCGTNSERFPVCRFCKCENMLEFDNSYIENIEEEIANMSEEDRLDLEKGEPCDSPKHGLKKYFAINEYMRRKYAFTNSQFSKAKYNERVEYIKEIHKQEELGDQEAYDEVYGRKKVTCPTCGSTNTKKISAGAKAVSVGLFGIFSQKVKHQFKCNSCGYEW